MEWNIFYQILDCWEKTRGSFRTAGDGQEMSRKDGVYNYATQISRCTCKRDLSSKIQYRKPDEFKEENAVVDGGGEVGSAPKRPQPWLCPIIALRLSHALFT